MPIGKRIAAAIDWLLFLGWTGIGLLNFLFFIVHANPSNVAGIFSGDASTSFMFMSVSAFVMLGVSAYIVFLAAKRRPRFERARAGRPWMCARAALAAFACFFVAVEALIIAASFPRAVPAGGDLIILGAHVSRDGLSATLESRLDRGFEYLSEHPGARVIVSGGQGLDEPTSEAAAMRDYLVSRGIDTGRIELEDASHNTFENLANSRLMLPAGPERYPVTVVTSEFHIFRTAMLAERTGFSASFIPAATPPSILPSCYSREFFGIIKSFFSDRP